MTLNIKIIMMMILPLSHHSNRNIHKRWQSAHFLLNNSNIFTFRAFKSAQFQPRCHPALPELDILENPTLQVKISSTLTGKLSTTTKLHFIWCTIFARLKNILLYVPDGQRLSVMVSVKGFWYKMV